MMNKILHMVIYIVPFIVLIVISFMITSMIMNKLYPRINYFSKALPELEMREFSMNGDLDNIINFSKVPKKPYILNIFNSTCGSCITEHPQLMTLANEHNITIYGVAFNDNRDSVKKFLTKAGNPYKLVGITGATYDFKGLNIKHTPISFLIDVDGKIRYRHKGIITPKMLDELIVPMMREINGL